MSANHTNPSEDLCLVDPSSNLYYNPQTGKHLFVNANEPLRKQRQVEDNVSRNDFAAEGTVPPNVAMDDGLAGLMNSRRMETGKAFCPPVTSEEQSEQWPRNDSVAFEPDDKVDVKADQTKELISLIDESIGAYGDDSTAVQLDESAQTSKKTIRATPSLFDLVQQSRAETVDEPTDLRLTRRSKSSPCLHETIFPFTPRNKGKPILRNPEPIGTCIPPVIRQLSPNFSRNDLMRTCRSRKISMSERTILADIYHLQRDLRRPALQERERCMTFEQLKTRRDELEACRKRGKTLFDLPREVRDMIYLMVVKADKPLMFGRERESDFGEDFFIPGLAQTSWRLRSEFPAKEFWSENVFYFDLQVARPRPELRNSMRSIFARPDRLSNSAILAAAAGNIRHAIVGHRVVRRCSTSGKLSMAMEKTCFDLSSDGSISAAFGFEVDRERLSSLAKNISRPLIIKQSHSHKSYARVELWRGTVGDHSVLESEYYEDGSNSEGDSVLNILSPVLGAVVTFAELFRPMFGPAHSGIMHSLPQKVKESLNMDRVLYERDCL